MQSFEKFITVTRDDLDTLNHVNNVRYVQWVNDVAIAHWNQKATKEMLKKYAWALIKHNIEYKSAAVLNDVVKLKTYVTKAEGVTSIRIVEMYNNKTQNLLVRSETTWCLLNSVNLRPARITTEIINLFN
jgi:acyl-CoA thioester hydrolase